ncbi:hypothetical protein D3C84_1245680 [compost metagenome]
MFFDIKVCLSVAIRKVMLASRSRFDVSEFVFSITLFVSSETVFLISVIAFKRSPVFISR